MPIAAGETLSVNPCDALALSESVAVTVKAKEPDEVGVPVMSPALESERPGGSAPAGAARTQSRARDASARRTELRSAHARVTMSLARGIAPSTQGEVSERSKERDWKSRTC